MQLKRCPSVVVILFWISLIAGSDAAAHDSWLVADTTRVEPAEVVTLKFISSETFPVAEHATEPSRVASWVAVGKEGTQKIEVYRIEGDALVGRFTPPSEGVYTVAAALHSRFIEIEAERFEAYLLDERAEHAIDSREALGESDRAGREYYTKFVKTVVCAGPAAGATNAKPVGDKLEIVPLDSPCVLKVGNRLRVRVLFDGRPAEGFRLKAGHEGLGVHAYVQEQETDSNGEATFELTTAGQWFVRTHTIRRIEPQSNGTGSAATRTRGSPGADWESFWASLTFEVDPRPAGR